MDPILDDLAELRLVLERPPITQKTPEELEKLTVDEKLSDLERSVYILSCGQDVQRLSVVTSLPLLLRDDRDECLRRVIPKIREFLPIAQQDMQLAASSIFLRIFTESTLPLPQFSQHLLPIILNSLDSKDQDVCEAWLETLLEVIPNLTKEVLRKEVLPKAVQKGQLSQSVQSRLMSCRILGKISICLESFVIKKEILPLVQSLCQDVEYEVRACMCRQLDLVAKGMGLESTKSAILPELVELANDEENCVRLAGLDTVVSVLSLLDDETCVNTIIPLVVKFCQASLQDEDSTLPIVSRHLGKLCHGLTPNMTSAQKMWFLEFYKKLCLMGINEPYRTDKNDINDNLTNKNIGMPMIDDDRPVECRINAAYNFPAMAIFADKMSKFDSELFPTFSKLCKDPSISVRKTMAHGFHEVARTIGSHVTLLLRDLVILFKDDCVDVLRGLVRNLEETIDIFTTSTPYERHSAIGTELLPAILCCEYVIFASNDWRLKEEFLERISTLTKLCTSDQVFQKLVPLVFNKINNAKALPVRIAAVKSLLIFMRSNKRLEQRQDICSRIISDFARGKSYRNRTLFIDICMSVLELYSRSFFKEHFYESVLDLSSDSVANIRLRLCGILPRLKKTIKLPSDRNLLQQLESHVRKLLINERDRDVLSKLKYIVEELDKISCSHDSLHSRRPLTPDDLKDQEKEEQEQLLIELEEKERKEEEAELAAGGKKKEKKTGSIPKVTSSKSRDVEKINKPTQKGSKIPTTPAATSMSTKPEIRKNSFSNVKTNTTANGSLKQLSHIPNRLSTKMSGRTLGSANSTNSGGSLSSAGSSRSGRSSTSSNMGVASPTNSSGRKKLELENKRDTMVHRRTSRDAVQSINRKQSH